MVTSHPAARDEQHPRRPDGSFAAHCTGCGTYVEDTTEEPPADYLCEDC